MADEQEGTLEKKVNGGKHDRGRTYYYRRCKHKSSLSLANIDTLPDEILFQILLELEAEEIYESAEFVCRRWYDIIHTRNFMYEHLEHSNQGLLIQDWSSYEDPTFVTLSGDNRIHKFKYSYNFKSEYWATCNGLALKSHPSKKNDCILFVVNPATKQEFSLPRFLSQQCPIIYYSGIGYAPASKEYKVVRLCKGSVNVCAILTVGVDKSWRSVETRNISSVARYLFSTTPLITEGFVHWAEWHMTRLLSLNVESEIITENRLPEEDYGDLRLYYYLSTWRSLTMLIASSQSGLSWDVWEMKKPESGEWKKVVKIDLEGQKCRLQQHLECTLLSQGLVPVGWLNYGEVLVLRVWGIRTKACVLYNVGTQETNFLDLGRVSEKSVFDLHKNSLVWFDGWC